MFLYYGNVQKDLAKLAKRITLPSYILWYQNGHQHYQYYYYFMSINDFTSCLLLPFILSFLYMHDSTTCRIRCDDVVDVDASHQTKRKGKKKNLKINLIERCYYISNQVNDIKLLWEKIFRMALVQWNRVADWCYSIERRITDRGNGTKSGRRGNGKYVSILTGVVSYSIHKQFFSQNPSFLSLL